MSRRKVREQIFKLLFQAEFHDRDEMEAQAGLYFAEEEPAVEEDQKEEIVGKLSKIIDCLD
ncbi:MAG: antitermination protein NusB, partial [Lachnospiraceae bacterium]|nr:antitermination protein NusB [Lachnospiraceae bacterium]